MPSPAARVELWHPIGRETAEISAWRDWLDRHQVTQPFKQAHQKVYPITVAEQGTRTYSNRCSRPNPPKRAPATGTQPFIGGRQFPAPSGNRIPRIKTISSCHVRQQLPALPA